MTACKHEHGDNVAPLMGWVCGQCFEVLAERPKRYRMVGIKVPANWDGKRYGGDRQEIAWQAEVLKSSDGTTLSTFIAAVARRFELRGGLDKDAAYLAALDITKMLEVPFGHPDYNWSRMGAVDLADEDMSYWDHDGPTGAN